ncbi:MAG: Nitrilotriacetate monooxygenase component A [Herbaspirillum frisingense]|uniref:Nitrilotriacetate monooxygenase component A n=1 Tax=Herbaspirillum frisingense TaxID=92645 RepID=A0A7V8FWR3_9BURK|nr:MAG: Nitrilotriacetate monooxygenase component A [Herbaspirillum frisingense]
MSTTDRSLILFANALVTGHHEAAWRMPTAKPERLRDIGYYQEIAQLAERGGFHALFVADFFVYYPGVRHSPRWELDPLTLLAGVAQATERLGVIATGSATFSSPAEIARAFATLDHVSGGRAAWNIVTNGEPQAAANFGQDRPVPHQQRYQVGAGAVQQVLSLWREETHAPAPLQAHPVLVQAGSSPDGRDFAARFAEVVFTAQNTLAEAQAFRSDMHARAADHGRAADALKIIPGISPAIGSTEEEARRKKRELDELIAPEASLAWLAGFGIDLDGHDLDGPLPPVLGDIDKFEGIKSRFGVIAAVIERHRPQTIRALLHLLAGSRGHAALSGTPESIAEMIGSWFEQGGADGFMLMPHVYPTELQLFVDEVVPLLRKRGILRDLGPDASLRQRLGLPAHGLFNQVTH